jgi:hypothetical protein
MKTRNVLAGLAAVALAGSVGTDAKAGEIVDFVPKGYTNTVNLPWGSYTTVYDEIIHTGAPGRVALESSTSPVSDDFNVAFEADSSGITTTLLNPTSSAPIFYRVTNTFDEGAKSLPYGDSASAVEVAEGVFMSSLDYQRDNGYFENNVPSVVVSNSLSGGHFFNTEESVVDVVVMDGSE